MTSPNRCWRLCQPPRGARGSPGTCSMATALLLSGHFMCGRLCSVAVAAGGHRRLNKIFTQQPCWGGSLHLPNSPAEKTPSKSDCVFPEIPSGPLSEKFLKTFTMKGHLWECPWLVQLGIFVRAHKTEKMVCSKTEYLVNLSRKHSLFYHHWPARPRWHHALSSGCHARCWETHAGVLALKWKISWEQFL